MILTGIADWQYQREEAEFIAGNVLGVNGVENDVDLLAHTQRLGRPAFDQESLNATQAGRGQPGRRRLRWHRDAAPERAPWSNTTQR